MKNAFILLMDTLGGAKAATLGNPAAVPPVLPTPAVGRDKWQARFWFTVGFLPTVTLIGWLVFLGIGSLWKDAGISLPSWGSNTQAQSPVATTVTNTIPKKKILVVPPIHVTNGDTLVAPNGSASNHQVVNIYTDATEVKKEDRSKLNLTPGTSVTKEIPLGKRASWSKSPATIKWKDLDGRWNLDTKETRNSPTTAIEFTAPADKSVEIEFILTDA